MITAGPFPNEAGDLLLVSAFVEGSGQGTQTIRLKAGETIALISGLTRIGARSDLGAITELPFACNQAEETD